MHTLAAEAATAGDAVESCSDDSSTAFKHAQKLRFPNVKGCDDVLHDGLCDSVLGIWCPATCGTCDKVEQGSFTHSERLIRLSEFRSAWPPPLARQLANTPRLPEGQQLASSLPRSRLTRRSLSNSCETTTDCGYCNTYCTTSCSVRVGCNPPQPPLLPPPPLPPSLSSPLPSLPLSPLSPPSPPSCPPFLPPPPGPPSPPSPPSPRRLLWPRWWEHTRVGTTLLGRRKLQRQDGG